MRKLASAFTTVLALFALAGGVAEAQRVRLHLGGHHCFSSVQCPSGSYCQKPVGACAAQGSCAQIERLCIRARPSVCGCNGRTYPTACGATRAGINIRHTGAC